MALNHSNVVFVKCNNECNNDIILKYIYCHILFKIQQVQLIILLSSLQNMKVAINHSIVFLKFDSDSKKCNHTLSINLIMYFALLKYYSDSKPFYSHVYDSNN